MMEERGEEQSWSTAGLRVTTTLDLDLQRKAEQTIAELFPAIAKKAKAQNISLVAIDRRTREVLAYVGSSDYFDEAGKGKIDMAAVPRQPGSSFKPFVYAAAFSKGLKSNGTIDDTPIRIGNLTPKNYDGTFKGRMTVKTALAWSRNIPAVRAFLIAGGEQTVLQTASAAGVTAPARDKERRSTPEQSFSYGWPLALGAAEVPLLEMVQGYATIASEGVSVPMKTIRLIEDGEGGTLYAPPDVDPVQAVPAQAAKDVAAILSDPRNRPAGFWRNALTIPGLPTGAKTGTSNLCFRRLKNGNCAQYGVNNTWIIGFTDDLVVGVWVGNADNSALAPKADGLTTAAPIWKAFLQKASAVQAT
jgi:membrane peptidoglycan carboxypeptidase